MLSQLSWEMEFVICINCSNPISITSDLGTSYENLSGRRFHKNYSRLIKNEKKKKINKKSCERVINIQLTLSNSLDEVAHHQV